MTFETLFPCGSQGGTFSHLFSFLICEYLSFSYYARVVIFGPFLIRGKKLKERSKLDYFPLFHHYAK